MPILERLTLNDIDFEVEKRAVDTVVVCFPDSHGRLVGVRVWAEVFLREVAANGLRVPAHLLCTDATGALATGFALSNPGTGLRDLLARVDQGAMFRMPWQPGSVGAFADLEFLDGTAVTMAPRTVLRRQLQRFEDGGMTVLAGAEQQFTLLDPADGTPLRGAGHILRTSAVAEPVLARARKVLGEVPIPIDGTSGLVSPGGYEVTLRAGEAIRTCDAVEIARTALTAVVRQADANITFMPAPDTGLGTALHLSLSARGSRGTAPLADHYGEGGLSEVGKSFVAGILEHAPELSVLYAPTVNSYRRYGADPVTPRRLDWGQDNRTSAVRLVEVAGVLRIENRIPGSDANPYLALAATIASGLDGVARQLRLPPQVPDGDEVPPALPASLAHAVDLWADSAWVRDTFGAEVREHYTVMARLEAMAARAGADVAWERKRYLDVL